MIYDISFSTLIYSYYLSLNVLFLYSNIVNNLFNNEIIYIDRMGE